MLTADIDSTHQTPFLPPFSGNVCEVRLSAPTVRTPFVRFTTPTAPKARCLVLDTLSFGNTHPVRLVRQFPVGVTLARAIRRKLQRGHLGSGTSLLVSKLLNDELDVASWLVTDTGTLEEAIPIGMASSPPRDGGTSPCSMRHSESKHCCLRTLFSVVT